jgi:hypothetical protein
MRGPHRFATRITGIPRPEPHAHLGRLSGPSQPFAYCVGMPFKDRVKRVTDDAIAKAKSDDVREKTSVLASTVQRTAHEFAESEVGQKLIGTAKSSASEALSHLADGDSVSQAAAKTAKTGVDGRTAARSGGSTTRSGDESECGETLA